MASETKATTQVGKVCKPVPTPGKPGRNPSGDLIDVKNISNRTLNLSHGIIPKGECGQATIAEFSYLSKYLQKV